MNRKPLLVSAALWASPAGLTKPFGMICRLQILVDGNQLNVVQKLDTHVNNTAGAA